MKKKSGKNLLNSLIHILRIAKIMESKDFYTACHSMNVAKYAIMIAKRLNYSAAEQNTIFMGALLHDLGKLGVSKNILNKPSGLTPEEYICIQQHPAIGFNMLNSNIAFQDQKILEMVLYHHERYDGTGYPYNLKAEEIPQCAAIISVADAFDAMTAKRVYHEPYTIDYALTEIKKNAGLQFDPQIADIFVDCMLNESNLNRKHNKFHWHNISNAMHLA